MYRDVDSTGMSGGPGVELLYVFGGQTGQTSGPNPDTDVMRPIADSPDGKYRLETYGVNPDIYTGGVYPCESIRIIDIQTGEICWQMEGWLDEEFSWSPNGRYAVVSYMNRISWSTLLVDTADMSEITLPGPYELAALHPEHPSVNTVRPDPDFRSDGWDDENTLRVNFAWRKAWDDINGITENDELIQGDFIYDVARGEIISLRWDDPASQYDDGVRIELSDMAVSLMRKLTLDMWNSNITLMPFEIPGYVENNPATRLAMRWPDYSLAEINKYPVRRLISIDSVEARALEEPTVQNGLLYLRGMSEIRFTRADADVSGVNGVNVEFHLTMDVTGEDLRIAAIDMIFNSDFQRMEKEIEQREDGEAPPIDMIDSVVDAAIGNIQ